MSKYFRISLREKDVYFKIYDIKKYHCYSAHGIDFHDYHIVIDELHEWNRENKFDDTYGGLFLYLDENKKVRILDNIKGNYIDIEENKDINNLFYYFEEKQYCTSLENVAKEILFRVIINDE